MIYVSRQYAKFMYMCHSMMCWILVNIDLNLDHLTSVIRSPV